jgi:hypothetical protein
VSTLDANTMAKEGDILFYDNLRVEFYQGAFYFFQRQYFGIEEQHLRLDPAIAKKLTKEIKRLQAIAQNLQNIMDRNPPPPSQDEIDGPYPLRHLYGCTVGIQNFSLVRLIMGTRKQKVEIWLQSFYIHHSDPCKIRPSANKIEIDVNESYFYLECFIDKLCDRN